MVTQYYGEDPESITQVDAEEYQPMEAWRKVWREGVVPLLSTESLIVLSKGLREDDPRIIQGVTTTPPPLQCTQDWPVEASCPLSYCGWQGDGLVTVGEVEMYFAKMCYEIDQRLGEPAGCRHALNWIDETPRAEMRRLLLEEVDRELKVRAV